MHISIRCSAKLELEVPHWLYQYVPCINWPTSTILERIRGVDLPNLWYKYKLCNTCVMFYTTHGVCKINTVFKLAACTCMYICWYSGPCDVGPLQWRATCDGRTVFDFPCPILSMLKYLRWRATCNLGPLFLGFRGGPTPQGPLYTCTCTCNELHFRYTVGR